MIQSGEIIKGFETQFVNNHNKIIDVSINAKTVYNDYDEPNSIEGSIIDISDQKKAKLQIEQYNKELESLNTSKDKFFSIVAHDLINSFSSLLGYSEILTNEHKNLKDEEIGEFSNNIFIVASKLYNLLNNLLDWSKLQTDRFPFEPQTINLKGITDDAIDLYSEIAAGKGIGLINEIEKEHHIYADYQMAHTIFRNLISNAVKFTNQGGSIKLNSLIEDGFVKVSIKDTGEGISQEDREKLFNIGIYNTQIGSHKDKGTGLGLILCKEFVEKNGGKIWVESEIGKWTSCNLLLPRIK
ncbi:MAG: HAMP domain-containing sensor histidine kinase [Bacteroidota bacterium]